VYEKIVFFALCVEAVETEAIQKEHWSTEDSDLSQKEITMEQQQQQQQQIQQSAEDSSQRSETTKEDDLDGTGLELATCDMGACRTGTEDQPFDLTGVVRKSPSLMAVKSGRTMKDGRTEHQQPSDHSEESVTSDHDLSESVMPEEWDWPLVGAAMTDSIPSGAAMTDSIPLLDAEECWVIPDKSEESDFENATIMNRPKMPSLVNMEPLVATRDTNYISVGFFSDAGMMGSYRDIFDAETKVDTIGQLTSAAVDNNTRPREQLRFSSDKTEHNLATSERSGKTDIGDQRPVVASGSLEDLTSPSLYNIRQIQACLRGADLRDMPWSPSPASLWGEERYVRNPLPAVSKVESEK